MKVKMFSIIVPSFPWSSRSRKPLDDGLEDAERHVAFELLTIQEIRESFLCHNLSIINSIHN